MYSLWLQLDSTLLVQLSCLAASTFQGLQEAYQRVLLAFEQLNGLKTDRIDREQQVTQKHKRKPQRTTEMRGKPELAPTSGTSGSSRTSSKVFLKKCSIGHQALRKDV
eukprot:2582577-Amphidinium_carterae.1